VLAPKGEASPTPFVFNVKSGTNNQYDFMEFLVFLVAEGHLTKDDVLVMDNCGIHVAGAIFELLDAAGIKLVFLPSYSPELNPCELVFAVKNYLCNHRGPESFWREILFALSTVMTYEDMWNVYFDCVWLNFNE